MTPSAGHFLPHGYVDVHWVMLHFKCQGSMPCGFRQEDLFHASPYISLCIACDPGVGYFWPRGHNLYKLGRGLLGNDIYQISKLYALRLQTIQFSMFFPL